MTISRYLLFSNQEFTDKTDFTFRKVWQSSGGNVEWPNGQEITVKLYSSKTDPAKESERTLVSTVVLKNTNVVSQTPEISGAEWEYLTEDNVTAFKIKNLPRFASDTDLTPLIYAVEEDQVEGYLTPGYTDADGELPQPPRLPDDPDMPTVDQVRGEAHIDRAALDLLQPAGNDRQVLRVVHLRAEQVPHVQRRDIRRAKRATDVLAYEPEGLAKELVRRCDHVGRLLHDDARRRDTGARGRSPAARSDQAATEQPARCARPADY